MPNNYLSVLYKHIIQVENKSVGLKVCVCGGGGGGHKHTLALPHPTPHPPLPTPVTIIVVKYFVLMLLLLLVSLIIIISQSVRPISVVYRQDDVIHKSVRKNKALSVVTSPAIDVRQDRILSAAKLINHVCQP